jgi:hypothetical protein
MLGGVLLFELRAHAGRLTFALAALFFGFLGFMTAATSFGPDDVFLNGPYTITNAMGLLCLGTVFSLTLFCAQSVLRDDENQMAEIVYSTAVTKGELLLGRFLGSFLAAVASFAAAPVGMILGTYLVPHGQGTVGPFSLAHYAWPFAVLALPSMLFVGAVLFAVAALTRSSLATYVAGVGLYVLYLAGALATDSPLMAGSSPTADGLARAAMLDPFGISAFFAQSQFWTPAERNLRQVAMEGSFLWNRVLVTLLGGLALTMAVRLFRMALPSGVKSGRRRRPVVVEEAVPASARVGLVPARTSVGAATWARALASRAGLDLRMALGGWPFLALLVLFTSSMSIEIWQSLRMNELGTALIPTTGMMLDQLSGSILPFGLLVIVYWSAELVWRDRAVNVHEIVDATPAPNGLFFVSKVLTLSTLVTALIVSGALTGMLFQIVLGPVRIQPGLYASLLVFAGIPLVLLSVLALFLQVLSPNRYVGMLVTVVVTLFWHRGALGGFDHPLLRYASAEEPRYSDMSGFSPLASTFGWLMLYGALLAALLSIAAVGLWRRGTQGRIGSRLRAFPTRLGSPGRAAFVAIGLAWLALAGFLYQQGNVVNRYETRAQRLAWRVAYERTYRHLEKEPQPVVAAQSVTVDLFPEEGRARTRGRLRLENRTASPIASIWIATPRDLRSVAVTVGGHRPQKSDARFGMHRFPLSALLEPGTSTDLTFDALLERRGLAADGEALEEVVPNGTFLLGSTFLPGIGYRFQYSIRDPGERRRQGLSELSDSESPDDGELVHDVAPKVPTETIVSTSRGETALAPGTLAATWVEGDRPHFRYTSEHPVSPDLAIVSARYEVARRRVRGVDVSVLYHPGHAVNVEATLESAARTLDYGIRNFGPYPLPELRLAEIPSTWRQFGGLAMPGLILLVEHRVFLIDRRDSARVDLVTKRVAHEVAHQWWGRELAPPIGPGASVLVESLARYSELMILKEVHGRQAIEPVLSMELRKYLSGRAGQEEVPLARATNQAYLYYSKGALVLSALEDLIGEEKVNRALRDLLKMGTAPGASPRATDLLDGLRAVTPAEHHRLLHEWFLGTALYDLRVTSATSAPLPDGRFRVTAHLTATRTVLEKGKEVAGVPEDPIEVEVLGEPTATGEPRVLHKEKMVVRGAADLSVVVDARPLNVAIDPHLRRIDRNTADNVRKVRHTP